MNPFEKFPLQPKSIYFSKLATSCHLLGSVETPGTITRFVTRKRTFKKFVTE